MTLPGFKPRTSHRDLNNRIFDLAASVMREHGFSSYIPTAIKGLSHLWSSRFNKRAILALIDFLDRWQILIEEEPEGVDKNTHLQLIQVVKGFPKCWRLWRLMKRDSNLSSEANRFPRTNLVKEES